ncbi:MAG: energy transducer TonB [Sporocytophaga sp.]|nr:energy transducer TonB [Sporocytophaga sp.]
MDNRTFQNKKDSCQNKVLPQFEAGMAGMSEIFKDSLVYPKSALHDRIGGKVIVKFTIDTTGTLTDAIIVKGIGDDLNCEAIRLVKLLKVWTPGFKCGQKVNMDLYLPVNFSPNKRFERQYKKRFK